MLIIGEKIVVILCVTSLFWSFAYRYQTQQALIWWNDRLWRRMCREGEGIRNGLLQESFVMRRHLELSSENSIESQQQDKYYLATIEKFHYLLKELSDYLSPAHIDDSLPLTTKHILESWKSRIPDLNFNINSPSNWHQESYNFSRIVLMVLDELLQITLSNSNIPSISINFKSQQYFNECTVEIIYLELLSKTVSKNKKEFSCLQNTFKYLTCGKCMHKRDNNTEIWYFKWKCS
ncbi:hypothetical protein DSM106972_014470 [Dulcicalothrix desertica PCC 7102]|uniref:Uncharacterized protein n=1 Tax=Dulcicalothrix desertica PCC 7102 TaxID=232991 RepID=A0A433VQA7_9CYAN|nr:hypothetical protein [Dulcicalothrix desertica]RUT08279.1 hypothetical protein DSM106972_014470 [Dulcicalothrix desertica PCC 7102]TWH40146.1 hypothetical protein CAL7102_09446 [Dulcicalothrix desertica PCC 7102]